MKFIDRLKRILLFLAKLLYYVVISLVCLIAAFLVYYIVNVQIHAGDENYKPKFSIYTIVSPSMTPNINVYDVVLNVRVDNPKDIHVGDIITYKSSAATSEGMTITHRVIAISQLPDGTYEYMTQGDNNSEPDSVYVTYDNVIGKEIIIIPYLGKVQFLIANQKGWLFLLLIPVSIYLIREIFKIIDLFGLRKRVNKVVGTTEESLIERKKAEKQKNEERKEKIKEELIVKETQRDSKQRSESETEGFLERYNETIINVKENKYDKYNKNTKSKSSDSALDKTIVIPTKAMFDNIVELEEEKTQDIIELPKEKPKKTIIKNSEYEILDTDDLTSKIKEYDSKIEQLDKMIKDIESGNNQKSSKKKKEEKIVEVDDFLQESKIKVISVEETKNKKKPKITESKRKTKHIKDEDVNFNKVSEIIYLESAKGSKKKNEDIKPEDTKEVRKEEVSKATPKKEPKKEKLNLNPKEVKKINRTPKKDESKQSKKLNLNPKNVKKVNRPNKRVIKEPPKEEIKVKPPKKGLIIIEKKK